MSNLTKYMLSIKWRWVWVREKEKRKIGEGGGWEREGKNGK